MGWFVPWDAIGGIGEIAVHGNPFLAIQVGDPAAIEMGQLQRLAQRANRGLLGIDLSVPLRTLDVDPAELGAAVARYLEHPELRSRIGGADELAAVREAAPPEPEAVAATRAKRRPSIGRIIAIGSLLLVGGFLALVSLAAAIDEVRPDQEPARLLGIVLFGGLALAQIAAAILLVRKRPAGRRIGIVAVVGTLGLALYALLRSEPDERSIGVSLVAMLAVQLVLVVAGARDFDTTSRAPARSIPS